MSYLFALINVIIALFSGIIFLTTLLGGKHPDTNELFIFQDLCIFIVSSGFTSIFLAIKEGQKRC